MAKDRSQVSTPLREVRARLVLKLLPSCLSDVHSAILRELSGMLLKIEPTVGGVPLTVKRIKVEGNSGAIFEDHPHIHLKVVASFLVFAPEPGQMLSGIVNNVADDTIGLLIFDTFNAVISKDQLPDGFSFNHKNLCWSNTKLGHKISVGSTVLFKCTDMRTTEHGLIQVLASFVGMGDGTGIAVSSTPEQKGKKRSKGETDSLASAEQEPSKQNTKSPSQPENTTETKKESKKKKRESSAAEAVPVAETPPASKSKKTKTKSSAH